MQSNAKTVEEYMDEIPAERKEQLNPVRDVILKNLPDGFEECMNWGMITYEVPLSYYPYTYNKKPLLYAALASQKNHMAVYLSGIYCNDELRLKFENDYKASGKKMNMGKSCVRFRKLEDLPLNVIGDAIGAVTIEQFVEITKRTRRK